MGKNKEFDNTDKKLDISDVRNSNNEKIMKSDVSDKILDKLSQLFIKFSNGEITQEDYIKGVKEINK